MWDLFSWGQLAIRFDKNCERNTAVFIKTCCARDAICSHSKKRFVSIIFIISFSFELSLLLSHHLLLLDRLLLLSLPICVPLSWLLLMECRLILVASTLSIIVLILPCSIRSSLPNSRLTHLKAIRRENVNEAETIRCLNQVRMCVFTYIVCELVWLLLVASSNRALSGTLHIRLLIRLLLRSVLLLRKSKWILHARSALIILNVCGLGSVWRWRLPLVLTHHRVGVSCRNCLSLRVPIHSERFWFFCLFDASTCKND